MALVLALAEPGAGSQLRLRAEPRAEPAQADGDTAAQITAVKQEMADHKNGAAAKQVELKGKLTQLQTQREGEKLQAMRDTNKVIIAGHGETVEKVDQAKKDADATAASHNEDNKSETEMAVEAEVEKAGCGG